MDGHDSTTSEMMMPTSVTSVRAANARVTWKKIASLRRLRRPPAASASDDFVVTGATARARPFPVVA